MKNGISGASPRRGLLVGVTLLAAALTGCEGGKENAGQAENAAAFQHPDIQPGLISNPQDTQIETLKASLFDDPENEALLSTLGDAYFEARRFQEAIPVYEKALKINPDNADNLNDLGLAYYYTGDTNTALEAVTKATEADPDYKYPWLTKGFILISSGRPEEARVPLNKALELDPNGDIGQEARNFLKKIDELKNQGLGRG